MQLVMHDPKIEMNHFNQWWLIKDGADFILFAEVERSAATGCAGIKLTEDEVEHYKGIGKPYLDFLARRLQAGVYADNNVAWDPAYRQILYPKEQSS